jgi:NAD(P)H dehydrogenase (quinone)
VKILVVFASETGRTQRVAEAVAEGAREGGAEVELVAAAGATDDALLSADAIALGSAVHMGSLASSMAAFFERSVPLWVQGRLHGKLGAAFVTASKGGRGGGELALMALLAFLAEHGLLLVTLPNRLEGFREAGCHWGTLVETHPPEGSPGPTETQLGAARAQGRYLAECVARWRAGADASH